MIFSHFLYKAMEVWREEDAVSRFVIGASLLLVIFAYLPTLQFDYVTQDQWRAFRYSIEAQSVVERAKSCTDMISQFYVSTGRPLVWMTECIEHAAVSNISDFTFLRPIVLATVVATVIYLGLTLSPFIGGTAYGIIAASAFVMVPGYSFMYLQGMTAMMVLVAVIFASISYKKFSQRKRPDQNKTQSIILSCVFFILACLIYPAYAFVVLPFTLIEFGFNSSEKILARFKNLIVILGFYFVLAVIYYLCVKASVFWLQAVYGNLPKLGAYEVTIQLTPALIMGRALEAVTYFYRMPPFNFSTIPGLPLVLLVAFSIGLGWISSKKNSEGGGVDIFKNTLLILVVSACVLFASISPWLFSKMDGLGTRHVLPWYLFYCAASFGLASIVLRGGLKSFSKWAPLIALLFFLFPVAVAQNRLSLLETIVTGAEIQAMRGKIYGWVDRKGWIKNRYLLIVLPSLSRPIGVENILNNTNYGIDNAVLASSKNPVSIPWMVNAFLRERTGNQDFKLVDCAFEKSCVSRALENPKNVVISYTNGFDVINSPIAPYEINLSKLTSKPVKPSVNLIEVPTIIASSTFDELGPYGLLSSTQPGWHAESPPRYPQTIFIDFKEAKFINQIAFLPQDGHSSRMPKAVRINLSNDGTSWVNVAASDNICDVNYPGDWRTVKFSNSYKRRFMNIEILANCGDQNFLTLKGLRVE